MLSCSRWENKVSWSSKYTFMGWNSSTEDRAFALQGADPNPIPNFSSGPWELARSNPSAASCDPKTKQSENEQNRRFCF